MDRSFQEVRRLPVRAKRIMHLPLATYRIQFNKSFDFGQALRVIPYLAELGMSDIYASPIFKASPGSTHGYDVVDPRELNPELGGTAAFDRLVEERKKYDIGWIQDVVPNHMAYHTENKMLLDVLENGRDSPFFTYFDIEWDHPYEGIRGRLLAPFLGGFYGETLENGEIELRYDENGLTVNYYALSFPLKVESYTSVLTYRLSELENNLGENHPDYMKFLGILYILKNLPSGQTAEERYDEVRIVKGMLWELYSSNEQIKRFINNSVAAFNGREGVPDSFNRLDELLSEQLFRLCFWKVATEEINYRRFFNINNLICVRVEDPQVFEHSHSLIFKLIDEGKITGLRIDHIDGLYDPTGYLKRLREGVGDVYIVVEKILDTQEQLVSGWSVQGTTGYDFLNFVNGIFCERENRRAFDNLYSRFGDLRSPYEALVADKKRLIIGKHMAADVDNLALLMKRISGRYRHGGDVTLYGLKRALVEVMAFFPVYRTYISHEHFNETDQLYIKMAIARAARANPGLLYELHFIERFLLLKTGDYVAEEEREQWVEFVMRFQQFTGPMMAKGFEDTLLYVYNRLLALNEVGGNPGQFGVSAREFHAFNKQRAESWPHSLSAMSTHDTKRGEDVRARINVLSEIPKEWERSIRTWSSINRRKKKKINGVPVPERNDEYFLYQTLVGAFPFDADEYPLFVTRVKDYVVKAVREAKVHTAWLKPDTDYEDAFKHFIDQILQASEENEFLKEFLPFQRKIAHYGVFNSLSQTLIKITAPGVPDFYQGTELWDLNLVDPDNRRPVDFEKRRLYLLEIKEKTEIDILKAIPELLAGREDGRIKLFLIYRGLQQRKKRKRLFQNGDYFQLDIDGQFRNHIICFARRLGNSWAITVLPRFLTAIIGQEELPLGKEVWSDTRILLADGAPLSWKDAITGEVLEGEKFFEAGRIFEHFPVALLMNTEAT